MVDGVQPGKPAWIGSLQLLIAKLFDNSGAAALGLNQVWLVGVLEEVGRKYLAAEASESDVVALFSILHVGELVLARACAEGNERAWEVFLVGYREKLYGMARHIAREDAAGRELADSLYADLFGTSMREGRRVSKLTFYTGRGSLEGWLRTVLAQQYIDQYRSRKRLVSLEEQAEDGAQFTAADPEPGTQPDPRLDGAVDEALNSLKAEERFILAAYYLDGRTLAEIAAVLGVHACSISRRLDKIAVALRKQIVSELRDKGLSSRQAEELIQVDVRDLQVDIRARLAQDRQLKSFPDEKVRARATQGPE